jgi:anti-sigma regulatory factor (Ser/Thr protein kinase)
VIIHAQAVVAELARIRGELRSYATTNGVSDDILAAAATAVNEACTNCIKHAYAPGDPGPIDVDVWSRRGALCVSVRDYGRTFNPHATHPAGALGLRVISATADYVRVIIHFRPRGCQVTMIFEPGGKADA